MRAILALAWAEVLHVVRDRATVAQALLVPVVQLLILANAATFEIRDTPSYFVDLDRTSASRGLIARFAASGHFSIRGDTPSTELANEALLRGDVTMVLVIPADFEASLIREGTARVQLAVNAEKGTAAGIVQGYASQILSAYARELRATPRPAPRSGSPRIEVRTRSWYNAQLNYRHYMVPGVLVALVTIVSTLLASQNIARERELGTLEQLNVTPISRGQFIIAKLAPFWVLAMFDLAVGLAVGRLAFGIPMRGSLLLLFGAAAIYLLVTLGIGLWISTIVQTQQQAMFVTFLVLLVYLLMSGLFTPLDSMPRWAQMIAELNPVRHFVAISRAILVRGAGLEDIARPLAALLIFAPVAFTFAIRQYRKRTA